MGISASDPRLTDALARSAAASHADAEPDNVEAAEKFDRDRSTMWRWGNNGRGSPLDQAHQYIARCNDPYRALAALRATGKMKALLRLTRAELIERYRELRAHSPRIEGEDSALQSRPLSEWDWEEMADASERDSAIDAEMAACERLFKVHGITPEEVLCD